MREGKVIQYILKFIETAIMKSERTKKNNRLEGSIACKGFEPFCHKSK